MKKALLLLLALLLALSMNFSVFAAADPVGERTLALYIGSPLTISGGGIKALDPDNPNVAPIIHKSRTLVPVRAIAEHFGSEVSYDAVRKAAVIAYKGETYYFYVGKGYYTSVGAGGIEQRHVIDTETLIRESRAMVPLRAICEEVLDMRVSYSRSVILVGDSPADLTADTALRDDIKARIGQAVRISSLEQLQAIVAPKVDRYGAEMAAAKDKAAIELAEEAAVSPTAGATSSQESAAVEGASGDDAAGYSTTTIQVEGIDEADVVKTDGKFIYVAAGGFVSIIKADAGTMSVADVIKMPKDAQTGSGINISDIYIDEGRLVILGTMWRNDYHIMPMTESGASIMEADSPSIAIYPPISRGRTFSYCGVYAIDENGQTELLRELQLEGSMVSSRKSGDFVYIATNKYMNYYYPDYPAEILPMYRDTAAGSDYQSMSADRIMYYPDSLYPQYMIVAALDIMDTGKEATIEAMLGSGSTIYMNDSALYVASPDYGSWQGTMTGITKFSIDGTRIGFAGGGKVPGNILNQFSMDEHEGNFRIATTDWNRVSTNALYILDSELDQIGAIENIAPGERIYAVRFMGNKGYIVTFRQIDPLFVLDLSDPFSPKITGELKVPGFSNFLYPIGEDILMGVGQASRDIFARDENGKETVIGTMQTGIKFSMFDVSDQGKPKEMHSYVLGGSGSYSDILYNHKAIMLDRNGQAVAFDASIVDSGLDGKALSDYFTGAVILSYDFDDGFDVKGRIAYESSVVNAGDTVYYSYIRRVCYIGDVLYYVQDGLVRSFDLDTLKPISSVGIWK